MFFQHYHSLNTLNMEKQEFGLPGLTALYFIDYRFVKTMSDAR